MKNKDSSTNKIVEDLRSLLTSKVLKALLGIMKRAFEASKGNLLKQYGPLKGFHRNLENFKGCYLFGTFDGTYISAKFENGGITIEEKSCDDWDVRVMFRSDAVLLDFLIFGKMDILKPLLHNDVQVDGNVNYLAKFGFMARDLLVRSGLIK